MRRSSQDGSLHATPPAAQPSTKTGATNASEQLEARTRLMLEGPIARTLLRLAAPNLVVVVSQSLVLFAETYFVGKLGTDALAGVTLVYPVIAFTVMLSSGAVGASIGGAVSRALGGGRHAEANTILIHGLIIAALCGLAFMIVVLSGGSWLYATMGGRDRSLAAAVQYSNVIFAAAIPIWIFNALAHAIRGTGNMVVPAAVICAGAVVVIVLMPCLIFGWGPVPGLGVAGAAAAEAAFYAIGSAVLLSYLRWGRSYVSLTVRGITLDWTKAREMMRVGAIASLTALQTNLTIAIATAMVGYFGAAAIAGYGVASRLEYLLVPIVFGLGAPLIAVVGTCIGAGNLDRALRVTWIGAAMAVGATEIVGLVAAIYPKAWLSLFDTDPAMLDAGARYLQAVGPVYGMFGLGMALFYASQGAGRLTWPLIANFLRLIVVAVGGWLALSLGGELSDVFAMLAIGLCVFGLVSAVAVARGSLVPRKFPSRAHA